MFRSQQIIVREYVCTSLKVTELLENTEFKILKIIPGVVAAIHVAGVRGDSCGAVKRTAPQTVKVFFDKKRFSVFQWLRKIPLR